MLKGFRHISLISTRSNRQTAHTGRTSLMRLTLQFIWHAPPLRVTDPQGARCL